MYLYNIVQNNNQHNHRTPLELIYYLIRVRVKRPKRKNIVCNN
jgi:hypothetical protein